MGRCVDITRTRRERKWLRNVADGKFFGISGFKFPGSATTKS